MVERFDRLRPARSQAPPSEAQSCELAWVKRLHQEDFAQALGYAHFEKYETDGGPSFAQCVRLLRDSAKRPAIEITQLIRWFSFCLIIGNRDNHAKNLARVFDGGHWRLAPFYDLVCTRAYKDLDGTLAMSVGQHRDISRLNTKAWLDEAKRCGLGSKTLLFEVREMCRKVEQALQPTYERVQKELAIESNQLTPVLQAILKGLRVTSQDLD